MKNSHFIKYFTILALPLISGCQILNKTEKLLKPLIPRKLEVKKSVTKQKKVSITTCKKAQIEDYTKEGWKIIDSEERSIVCTWRSARSKPGCNLERDKGCKITVPDIMGKEILYNLEKTSELNSK